MKALVMEGAEHLVYRDVPDPVVTNGESLVRVDAVGICGSDMHAYLGHDERRPAPLVLGHEAAGVVLEGPRKGKRVTVNPLVSCGTCRACRAGRTNICPDRQILSMPPREGAFAEAVVIPDANLVEVPDRVSMQKAALAEPLSVCWHAVRMSAQMPYVDIASARCLVLGGGAIGVGSALALKAYGARNIDLVEVDAGRAAYLSARCGIEVIRPEAVADSGYDLVIDAVGFRGTRASASLAVCPGGTVCHIGLGDADGGLDIRRTTLQEITFFGTYTYTAQDFRDAAAAIFDGRFGPLDWIEERRMDEGSAAFADLRAGRVAAPKIVLTP